MPVTGEFGNGGSIARRRPEALLEVTIREGSLSRWIDPARDAGKASCQALKAAVQVGWNDRSLFVVGRLDALLVGAETVHGRLVGADDSDVAALGDLLFHFQSPIASVDQ